MIKDIEVGKDANPGNFTVVEDYCFFSTHKIDKRNKLWITDGNEENTRNTEILNDADVNPTRLNLFRGKLFFIAQNPVYGAEIHYLDFNTPESVQGNVYHDVNENGRKDPQENGINNQVVLATSDNGLTAQIFTGLKGDFAFYPQSGVFEISPLAGECWELSSEPDYYRVNVDTGFASGLNFGFRKVIDHEGVNVSISSGPVRCGFTVPFWLNVYNTGCQPFSGEISLDLGTLAEVMSYDIAPTVNQNGRVSWEVDALDESAVFQVKLLLQIPGEEFVGDNVEIKADAYILREDGLATAVRELDGAKFNIYPNPANTRFIIEQDESSPHSAKIYNLLGHLILEITQLEPTTIIDVSGLPAGLYILEIRNRKSQRRLIEKIEKVN